MKSGDGARVAYPLFQEEDGGANPTSPLQLKMAVIDEDLAILLNKLWHSRLPGVIKANIVRSKHRICYGFFFKNVWFACAIWTNPIARAFNDLQWLELRRLAISSDAPKYTASRTISLMVNDIKRRFPFIKKLISYQDTDVHYGTIYKASGWIVGGFTPKNTIRWDKPGRKRNKVIATGDKIRWEKDLR